MNLKENGAILTFTELSKILFQIRPCTLWKVIFEIIILQITLICQNYTPCSQIYIEKYSNKVNDEMNGVCMK